MFAMLLKILLIMMILSVGSFANDDIDTLFSRLKNYYLAKKSNDTSLIIMRTQAIDGSWKSLNYDFEKGRWPSKHLNRIKSLSSVYELFPTKKDSLRIAIIRGLEFWFNDQARFIHDNWWVNEIGIQREINRIALIVWNEIPENLKEKIIKLYPEVPNRNATNRAWISENVIIRGLFEHNEQRIFSGLNALSTIPVVTNQEGHQIDHTYLMHGRLLYNGGYGKVSLSISAKWASITKNTKFAFSKKVISEIASLALEGNRWMMWGGMVDVMCLGREIARKEGNSLADSYLPLLKNLRDIDSHNLDDYDAWQRNINKDELADLVGNRYFWRGEFLVMRRPFSYVSLKMSSNRVVGSEYINKENAKGLWLGMGVLSIYRHPSDYKNIYPLWDWNKLPGVTSYNQTEQKDRRVTNFSDFSGGVCNQEYCVASMIASRLNLKVKKTWFFFEDYIIALGAGIKGSADLEITTSVDQRLVNSEIVMEQGKIKKDVLYRSKRFWLDSIAYVSLDEKDFLAKFEHRKGNWRSIGTENKKESGDILNIWLTHGINPTLESYAYLIDLNVKLENIFKKQYKDFYIVRNDSNFQIVCDSEEKTWLGTFFSSDTIRIKNVQLGFSEPAIFMLQRKESSYKLFIADPLQKKQTIWFNFSYEEAKKTTMFKSKIELPKEDQLGSTKMIEFKLGD